MWDIRVSARRSMENRNKSHRAHNLADARELIPEVVSIGTVHKSSNRSTRLSDDRLIDEGRTLASIAVFKAR